MAVEDKASAEAHQHAGKHTQDAIAWVYMSFLLAHRLQIF
jgi:hypothetical protein